MTDELLFSALGLSMDTGVERQLLSSNPATYALEYEGSSSCRTTPHSDDSEIGDPHAASIGNPIGCYTDLSWPAKGQSSWNEWCDNNSASLSGKEEISRNFVLSKRNETKRNGTEWNGMDGWIDFEYITRFLFLVPYQGTDV